MNITKREAAHRAYVAQKEEWKRAARAELVVKMSGDFCEHQWVSGISVDGIKHLHCFLCAEMKRE